MTLFSSIDIGSNTIRLLVAQKKGNTIIPIYKNHKITRLGKNLADTGNISQEAIKLTLQGLTFFKKEAISLGAKEIWAEATSAVRNARNRIFFINHIKNKTGIIINTISWIEEAQRTLLGISYGLKNLKGTILIFDIGGGSTEFVLSKGNIPIKTAETDLGVVRLAEKYFKKEPVYEEDFKKMEKEIENKIKGTNFLTSIRGKEVLVGTAGTITTIAALDLGLFPYNPEIINGHIISKNKILNLLYKLKNMTLEERLAIPQLETGREDLIVPGIVIVKNIMELFDYEKLTISEWSLLEGIILNRIF